jgi:hypothetical protein
VAALFMREVKIDAFPEGRVTLLGDAAHAMSICKFLFFVLLLAFDTLHSSRCGGKSCDAGCPQAWADTRISALERQGCF